MARLVYVDRNGRERSVTIGPDFPKVTVGRNPDCVIHTTKPSVSRLHTEFVYNRGVFEVTDLGSSNGTFINGREIRRQALRDRDEVRCGDFTIRFFMEDDPAAVGAPPPQEDAEAYAGYGNQPTSRQPVLDRPDPAAAPPPPYQDPGGAYPADADPYQRAPYGNVQSGSGYQRQQSPLPTPPAQQPTYTADPGLSSEVEQLRRDNQTLREKIDDQQAVIDVMRDDAGAQSLKEENERLRRELETARSDNRVLRTERDDVLAAADANRGRLVDLDKELSQQTLAIESLQEKNRSLNEEAGGARIKIDEARDEAARAKGEVGALERQVDTLKRAEADHLTRIQQLTDELAEQRSSLSRVERDNDDSRRAAQEIDQELKRLRQENESLQSLVSSEGNQTVDLERELESLRSILESKEAELVEADQRATEFEEQAQTLRAQLSYGAQDDELVAELEARQKTIEDLERKNDALRTALEDGQGDDAPEVAELEAEIERLKSAAQEPAGDDHSERIAELEAEVEKLEAALEDAGDVAEMRAALKDAQSQVRDLEVAQQNLENELAASVDAAEKAKADAQDAKSQAEAASAEAEKAVLDAEQAVSAAEEAQSGSDGSAADLEALESEISDLRAANRRYNRDMDRLMDEMDELREKLATAEARPNDADPEPAGDKALEDREAAIADLEGERDRLQAQAREREELIGQLETELKKLEGGLAAASSTVQAPEPAGDSELAQLVEELQQELEALAAENGRLKDDLDALGEEHQRLESQIQEQATPGPTNGQAPGPQDLQTDLQSAFAQLEQAKEQLLASQKWLTETTNHISQTTQQLSAASQQLAPVSDAELAGGSLDQELKDQATGTYETLNDDVASLRTNIDLIGGYVGDIRKLYDAVQRADLQALQTLDRVRIEKALRELEPEVTFASLTKAVGDCTTGADSMREELRTFREKLSLN